MAEKLLRTIVKNCGGDFASTNDMNLLADALRAAATVPAGMVRVGTEDMRLLGTLPVTKDRCVYGFGYPTCWLPSLRGGAYMVHTTHNGEGGGHFPKDVYSTREAAEAAAQAARERGGEG